MYIFINDLFSKIILNVLSRYYIMFGPLTIFANIQQASQDKKSLDVGANLFVGNLDPVSFHPLLSVFVLIFFIINIHFL